MYYEIQTSYSVADVFNDEFADFLYDKEIKSRHWHRDDRDFRRHFVLDFNYNFGEI